jgi:hypothetical protein
VSAAGCGRHAVHPRYRIPKDFLPWGIGAIGACLFLLMKSIAYLLQYLLEQVWSCGAEGSGAETKNCFYTRYNHKDIPMRTYFEPDQGISTRSYNGSRRGRRRRWPPPGWEPEPPPPPPERDRSMPVMVCTEVRDRDGRVRQWRFHCPGCGQEHRHSPMPGIRGSHCSDRGSRLYGCTYYLVLLGHEVGALLRRQRLWGTGSARLQSQ